MKSIHKNNFFDDNNFNKIQNFVFKKIEELGLDYGKEFKRYYRVIFLPEDIKSLLLDKARQETKDESLEIIYTQIVKYKIKDGIIPELGKHKDIVTGQWVMDIVIDSTINWPLIIEDEIFENLTNSVSFIKGEEDLHWRPNFPSTNEEDYLLLLFVHLANKDTEYYRVSQQIFNMKENMLNSFLKAFRPFWKQK
jgi:hypothetical protein